MLLLRRLSTTTACLRGGRLVVAKRPSSTSTNSSCAVEVPDGSRRYASSSSSLAPPRREGAAASTSHASDEDDNDDQRRLRHQVVSTRVGQAEHDRLLVVGSGVAGCATALIAAELYSIPVTMVYAGSVPTDCNSYWAQGGIIYRNYNNSNDGTAKIADSPELLAADIHRAGAGLCYDGAVQKVAKEGPGRVRQLLLNGHDDEKKNAPGSVNGSTANNNNNPFAQVPFDRCPETGRLSLCLEASHAAARILFKADHTGKTITQHITAAAARHPLITQQADTIVTDLMVHHRRDGGDDGGGNNDNMCLGVETLHRTTGLRSAMFAARGTVLCSGGLAGIYQHSTNPAGFNALGSSVALAVRAGAAVRDLEYVQFHPTALYRPGEARFLLTEALRGEGAVLRNATTGRAFARDYHADGELAPRDVVARAVFEELRKQQEQCPSSSDAATVGVHLDITHRDAGWLHERFPSIHAHLSERGLDLARDMLPITPAAHYTCGGIATDLNGRTSLRGLYAAGEAARTGLHGGNRLASTSLLEALVFGATVADFVGSGPGREIGQRAGAMCNQLKQNQQQQGNGNVNGLYWNGNNNHAARRGRPSWSWLEPGHIENASHRATQLLSQLKNVMWYNVGVVRTASGLQAALDELAAIQKEAAALYAICPTLETSALRDAVTAGEAVAAAARANPRSAGAHCVVPDESISEQEMDRGDDADVDSDEEQVATL